MDTIQNAILFIEAVNNKANSSIAKAHFAFISSNDKHLDEMFERNKQCASHDISFF